MGSQLFNSQEMLEDPYNDVGRSVCEWIAGPDFQWHEDGECLVYALRSQHKRLCPEERHLLLDKQTGGCKLPHDKAPQ